MSLTRPAPAAGQIPPLQNGDRLTRAEFERRYDAMPNLKKAELLEGVVYMPSPVSFEDHAAPHYKVIGWLATYSFATPGTEGGDNGSIRLDLDNMPQPDAVLCIRPECGGQAHVGADGYVEGAPELVFEVAASSVSYDLNVKLNVYRRSGVAEYVVWRVQEEAIDWFALREGRYAPLAPDDSGVYRSEVFPGLWLDAPALVRGDMAAVMQAQQHGFADPKYAAFAARLRAASPA